MTLGMRAGHEGRELLVPHLRELDAGSRPKAPGHAGQPLKQLPARCSDYNAGELSCVAAA
jgi:hypothetical protein